MSAEVMPPEGYRLATDAELDCLPKGSLRYWGGANPAWLNCLEGVFVDVYFRRTCVYSIPITTQPVAASADPKGEAGKAKSQLQLIPPSFNRETAKALACGAAKYGPWNWRQNKVELMTYLGAMRRHIDAVMSGEDLDPESGAHHLGHVAAGCAIVIDAAEHGQLIDNRPRKP